jgi:hypothetical protein
MRHPDEGTLRMLADEPSAKGSVREHVAECATCQAQVAAMQEDAEAAAAAMRYEPAGGAESDVDRGWHRLSNALAQAPARSTGARRWRVAWRSPVIAVVGVIALISGASVAAATDWLQIFRTEQITTVTAPEADLVKLPDLSGFGTLEVTEKVDMRKVDDAAAAQAVTGLAVPKVDALPRGVTGEPTYRAAGRASAVFTFSAEKAARSAAASGQTLPPVPEGLDGSRFRLVGGPAMMAVWSKGRGVPTLIVARAVAPAAYSEGVPFETARDYLLSLPMLSQEIAAQLRGFTGDGTTLPLIVSQERMATSTADVGGVQATVLTARNGVMAAVVWVDKGVVTAVGGSLSADEVLTVARGLR